MTLEEAIEFNKALQKDIAAKGMTTYANALQLGIEALKSRQEHRRIDNHPDQELLPGETK